MLFNILPKKRSILHERWPVAGEVDEVAVKASNYLMEAAHSFRIHLKNHCAAKKPRKGETPAPEPRPNKAVIWVAKEFPKWQHIILSTLKQLNGVSLLFCDIFYVIFREEDGCNKSTFSLSAVCT